MAQKFSVERRKFSSKHNFGSSLDLFEESRHYKKFTAANFWLVTHHNLQGRSMQTPMHGFWLSLGTTMSAMLFTIYEESLTTFLSKTAFISYCDICDIA